MVSYRKLRSLFDGAEKIVERWNVSAEPMVNYRGSMRKCMSEDVYNSLESLASVSALRNEEIHEDSRRLVLAIDAFAREWVRFTDLSRAGADVNPAGSPELWAAYVGVRDNLDWPKYRNPEPIEQLVKREGVPLWQVAKIYGWGEDVHKVAEELEKPGTHYDPKTWQHPAFVNLLREVEDAWATRRPVDIPVVILPESQEENRPDSAPESLETLIQQRVPADQIAKMKRISIEEVEAAAAGMGVVLAGARFVRPATQAGITQEQIADQEAREKAFEDEQRAKAKAEQEAEKVSSKEKAAAVKRFKELRTSGMKAAEMKEKMAAEFPNLDFASLA